jgi:hypothetical protein
VNIYKFRDFDEMSDEELEKEFLATKQASALQNTFQGAYKVLIV